MGPHDLPVVKIVNPDSSGYLIINESDYDPDRNTLWTQADGEADVSPDVTKEDDVIISLSEAAAQSALQPPVAPEAVPGNESRWGSSGAEDLARDQGIDPDDLVGTGKGGRILVRDVRVLMN